MIRSIFSIVGCMMERSIGLFNSGRRKSKFRNAENPTSTPGDSPIRCFNSCASFANSLDEDEVYSTYKGAMKSGSPERASATPNRINTPSSEWNFTTTILLAVRTFRHEFFKKNFHASGGKHSVSVFICFAFWWKHSCV